ncbi:hypothetical protein EIN_098640 [Entamoeba invadens IP1]|uniref:Amino acid transporter transmembrane domain-containing protein n=1 Tax=Entamoeba invadens IP1 TaxID=370355 RepID=A0A0A1U0X6_ENTIV|nr:hypothetical protein EIN_098640 [Entamoeba invadens IP1]ELP87537.1 hypothetical protein EIN_098640 [Entamoeba invadens IP1]|eukprot:XP_004254308.1 hypothetical protein EIN_098640 [Entamoeba invadens IP1]
MEQGGAVLSSVKYVEDYENIGDTSSSEEEVLHEPTIMDALPFTGLKGISLISVFSLTLNVMIGTGVFGMPLAYREAGLILSLGLLLVFYVLTSFSAVYILESISRVGTYLKRNDKDSVGVRHTKVDVYDSYGYTSLASHTSGKVFKAIINVMMVVNCYGVLWSFVGTSVNSIGTMFWSIYEEPLHCPVQNHFSLDWQCQLTYYGSEALFALLVVPLSFMKLASQTVVQFLMMSYCVLVFCLMVVTCVVSLIMVGPLSPVALFEFSGFGTVFSHTAFALVCHISIPDIIAPAEKKGKTHIPIITSIFVASLFYGLIGAVCASTFGGTVTTPVTLNWGSYTGIGSGWDKGSTQWYAYIIRYLILAFPLVNLTSSFPIVAQTVAGNICSMFTKEFLETKKGKVVRYVALITSIIVPFILGGISSSLEMIFNLTGLVSFVLVFLVPCLYQLMSIKMFHSLKFYRCSCWSYFPKTPFSSILSAPIIVLVVFAISFVLFIVSIIVLVFDTISKFGGDSSAFSSSSLSSGSF